LSIEGTLSGSVSQDFLMELPLQPKKVMVGQGSTPGRFEMVDVSLVRLGGPVTDGQNRVLSEGSWKGKGGPERHRNRRREGSHAQKHAAALR